MQSNKPKVSIITPCYNGAKYLKHFFESLISQTYNNVEFIFVNDGSTDESEVIYKKYEPILQKNGWECKYIYKQNGGSASAINCGLKIFTGDYLIWPDCDDILYPNHIEEKVTYMEANPEFGIAYSPFEVVKIENPSEIIKRRDFVPDNNMFNNILEEKDLIWTLGTIIRTEAFLNVNPERKIPECAGGQNCQMQMPILYKYPCGYIPISLSKYVIHPDSHSHSQSKTFIKRRLDLLYVWFCSIDMLKEAGIFEKNMYKIRVLARNIKEIIAYYIKYIFSVRNEYKDYKYKIIYILGFKISIKGKINECTK